MEIENNIGLDAAVMPQVNAVAIGPEQLKEFTAVLQKYKSGRKATEARIIASEQWWKLRNTTEEQKNTGIGKDNGFVSKSGWLHNVIVSKHADAVEAYPEPNILPREESDRREAMLLSAIVPCVLEQNNFENTYSDVAWQKCKAGTGVYKVIWDAAKLNGLGDISVERVNLLNVYWQPNISDIQKSRYVFQTELWDRDVLEQAYPEQLKDKLKGKDFESSKFLYDDNEDSSDKVTVIEVYYQKYIGGKKTLQYCKYVNDIVLYATENMPEMAERGLYDHGKYPYVFDALYPIEGSPCGYGYVDICRNPQTEIDLLKTAMVKNAMVNATPRYMVRGEGSVNEKEFLDLSKPLVHATGTMSENDIRQIIHKPLDGSTINILDRTIQELRETSGNTETSTGNVSSGVTAASAIAALQEASGKGSRDSTKSAYRAYGQVVELVIELIRQFYDMPRQFRIVGNYGAEQFVLYTNANLKPQHQGTAFGEDMGYRLPMFDIKISAQKKNVYTKVTQNELALQFFQLGFFNPQLTDQALMCLNLMEFDGKDGVLQKVAQNGTMHQKLVHYMQLALMLAQQFKPELVQGLSQDIVQTMGASGGRRAPAMSAEPRMFESDNIAGIGKKEPTIVENARERSGEASQPEGGSVMKKKEDKK